MDRKLTFESLEEAIVAFENRTAPLPWSLSSRRNLRSANYAALSRAIQQAVEISENIKRLREGYLLRYAADGPAAQTSGSCEGYLQIRIPPKSLGALIRIKMNDADYVFQHHKVGLVRVALPTVRLARTKDGYDAGPQWKLNDIIYLEVRDKLRNISDLNQGSKARQRALRDAILWELEHAVAVTQLQQNGGVEPARLVASGVHLSSLELKYDSELHRLNEGLKAWESKSTPPAEGGVARSATMDWRVAATTGYVKATISLRLRADINEATQLIAALKEVIREYE